MASKPAYEGGRVRDGEVTSATFGYLGAIVLGPVIPLIVYLARRHSSWFVRWHATQALNVALTCLLYAISAAIVGALLAVDSTTTALIVMIPIAAAGWLIMVVHLVRGAIIASRGDAFSMPAWICSPLIK